MPFLESLAILFILLVLPSSVLFVWTFWSRSARARRFRLPFEEMQRPAGWSLQNRADDLMDDFASKFLGGILFSVVLWSFATAHRLSFILAIVTGISAISFLFWLALKDLRRYSHHRLGLRAEQVVGQVLDRLSSRSLHVFHDLQIDVPGHRYGNIDHVILTPAGVFVMETKARRKPIKAGPNRNEGHKLVFDGRQLIFPKPIGPDTHCLAQTRRNAGWLAKELAADNAESIPVHAALVFPGWWIEAKGRGDVTVLNHKQLAGYLIGRPPALTDRQFEALRSQLEKRARIDLGARG